MEEEETTHNDGGEADKEASMTEEDRTDDCIRGIMKNWEDGDAEAESKFREKLDEHRENKDRQDAELDRRDDECRKRNNEFLMLQRLKSQYQPDSSVDSTYTERMMKEIVYKESEKKRNEARFGKAHYCKHESKWISNQEVPCTSCCQERESQNLNWKGAQ